MTLTKSPQGFRSSRFFLQIVIVHGLTVLAASTAADSTPTDELFYELNDRNADNESKVKALIAKGADVNGMCRRLSYSDRCDGETPLMLAAERGKLDAVKTLIANGADPKVEIKLLFPAGLAAEYECYFGLEAGYRPGRDAPTIWRLCLKQSE